MVCPYMVCFLLKELSARNIWCKGSILKPVISLQSSIFRKTSLLADTGRNWCVVERMLKMYVRCHMRQYLTHEAAVIEVNALVNSCLEYCNSVFRNLSIFNLQKLQFIQNTLACTGANYRGFAHTRPILKSSTGCLLSTVVSSNHCIGLHISSSSTSNFRPSCLLAAAATTPRPVVLNIFGHIFAFNGLKRGT